MDRKIDLNDPRYVVEKTPSKINLSDSRFASESQAPKSPSDKQRSMLQSGLIGMAQGATFGFGDEAVARLESIRSGRPYEEVLQESKAMFRKASEQNPASYIGGELVGGIAPALVTPVTAPRGLAQATVPLARSIGLGAGTGALSGLGFSEGETAGEIARDVGIGGALGGALPVVGRGIAKATQSFKPIADETIKTTTTGFTGKTRAFLDQLDKNPEQVKRIEEKFAGDLQKEVLPEISMKIDRFVEKNPFAQRAKLNSRLSLEKIPEDVRVNKEPAIKEIDKVLDVLKKDTVTDTSREAQKILGDYRSRIINELGKTEAESPTIDVLGRDLKIFLVNIGEDIEKHGGYGNPLKNTKVGQTLKNVRRALDQELKEKAPDYKEIMKTVNNDTAASVRLTKQFMNKEGVDSGKINTFINRTSQKPQLMEIDRPTKRAVQLLEQDGSLQTLGQDIKDINLKKAIEARSNQGSNLTNPVVGGMTSLGLGLGGSIGGFPGAGIGGGIGGFLGGIASRQLEQRGGKIAESVLRGTKGIRTQSPVPQSTQRGFATQQGIQKGLLDQFLKENKMEKQRKETNENNFQNKVKNRVTQ